MARKSSSVKEALLLVIGILVMFYVLFNTFLRPIIPSSSILSEQLTAEDDSIFYRRNGAKVKVYMYDLPSLFTTGIIERHALARGSSEPSKATYPGHQHMGEWYLYSDMARPESQRTGSPVVRVDDPKEADLFYVPVFSSLSLIVTTSRPGNPPSSSKEQYSDEEMQLALADYLEGQEYWKRSSGRDHVIMAGDPNALFRILDRVKNAVLLVSDFGRVRPDQGSLVKDVVVPYAHRIRPYEGKLGVENRSTLLFFMGNRYRKDGGKIRDSLFLLFEREEDVIIKHGTQSRENRRAAAYGMHSSKFCLNPAGDTPSACRLFDAIVSLCVPVIISDNIELPFEDLIDYRKFAVFVGTEAALKQGYLLTLLREISDDKVLEYQKELLRVRRYFEYDNPKGAVNEIWREVAQKLPSIKLMINRDKRLIKKDSVEPDCSCLCANQTAPALVTSLL